MANPPFSHPQRDGSAQQGAAVAPASPNPFIGGRQPLAPGKNPPSLLSVDSPPAYLPELLILEPEDNAAYFRAQRWPWQKIIRSIDNPPIQHYGRTIEAQEIVLKSWEPPPPMPAQHRPVVLPANVTGAFSSTGVGTDTWVGSSVSNTFPRTFLQAHIIRAWDIPATVQQRRNAVPQVTVASSSGDFSSAGVGTDTWVGASVQNTAPKADFQTHIIRAWEAPAPQPVQHRPVVLPATVAGDFSSVGAGTDTWVGALSQNTAPRLLVQPHIIAAWAPQQLIQQPRRFLPQIPAAAGTGSLLSQGVGLATWIGAETAKASFSSAGQGIANWVGHAKSATAARFDGWKPQRELLRRRRDEDEIMAILALALPVIQSGTLRAPIRLSVPRNVRSLH